MIKNLTFRGTVTGICDKCKTENTSVTYYSRTTKKDVDIVNGDATEIKTVPRGIFHALCDKCLINYIKEN
jgi:hypothetical protein